MTTSSNSSVLAPEKLHWATHERKAVAWGGQEPAGSNRHTMAFVSASVCTRGAEPTPDRLPQSEPTAQVVRGSTVNRRLLPSSKETVTSTSAEVGFDIGASIASSFGEATTAVPDVIVHEFGVGMLSSTGTSPTASDASHTSQSTMIRGPH